MSFSMRQNEEAEYRLTLMRLYSHKLSNSSIDDTDVTAACQLRLVNYSICLFGLTRSTNHRGREQSVQW